jgi:signal transduction histidine kinase
MRKRQAERRGEKMVRHRPAQNAEESVRGQILVPFTVLLSAVVASFLSAAYIREDRSQQAAMNASTEAVRQFLALEMEKGAAMMHSVMESLTQDQDTRRLLEAHDRVGLLAKIGPFFRHMRATQGITHLYFDTADRVNLLRVHDPALAGDTINRVTTLQALNGEEGSWGLEIGVLGSLTLRAVEPWRDENGKTIGLIEMGQDISQLTGQIAHILGVDLVVTVRKELVDRQRWQEGNRALGRQSDWDRLSGSVVVASTIDSPSATLLRLMDRPADIGEAGISQDGLRQIYTGILPLHDAGGRPVGDILVVRDVTDLRNDFRHATALVGALSSLAAILVFLLFSSILKRVEQDYRRKNEVERQFLRLSSEHERIIQIEKLSEVGRTIGEIAHQLNNPLVGVVNLSQLAERTVGDPERTRGLLNEIRRAGEDCRSLVHRMLQFTKVSRSERHPTDLAGVIEDTVALFHQSAKSRRPVTVEGAVGPVILEIDPILVRHALFNLLANADAASPQGAGIEIRLHHQAGDEKEWWGLSVIDQGPGVSKELMEKIFQPFFSTRPDGTGLGLPVAQHVAVLHGGRVAVSNNPEGGASFTLWLPAEAGPSAADGGA